MKANNMNPDQSTPKAALWSASILFAIYAFKEHNEVVSYLTKLSRMEEKVLCSIHYYQWNKFMSEHMKEIQNNISWHIEMQDSHIWNVKHKISEHIFVA